MAEQSSCADTRQFLDDAFRFLAEFAWIYNVKNTDIFVRDVLDKIPHEWRAPLLNLSLLELRSIPFNFFKDDWPSGLRDFVQRANKLATFRYSGRNMAHNNNFLEHMEVPDFIKRSTPSKKLHEIKCMAAAIGDLAFKYNINTVLDIGSGLGYLDQILHHNFGLTTVGFESVRKRSATARIRIEKGVCSQNMHHITYRIEDNEECRSAIETVIDGISEQKSSCNCGLWKRPHHSESTENILMVGLHSCGNLTQDMMKLFCKLQRVRFFLCSGCCYHKVTLQDFPMSSEARKVLVQVRETYPEWTPCTTGMRLGCQTTRAHWAEITLEGHVQQEKCLLYRAIIQCLLEKENLAWRRPKRHLRKDASMNSLEAFAEMAFQTFSWSDLEKKQHMQSLLEISEAKHHLVPHIRTLNLLQVLLQPVWEAVVTFDRVTSFQETNVIAEVATLCNELISPRNLLLFGQK